MSKYRCFVDVYECELHLGYLSELCSFESWMAEKLRNGDRESIDRLAELYNGGGSADRV